MGNGERLMGKYMEDREEKNDMSECESTRTGYVALALTSSIGPGSCGCPGLGKQKSTMTNRMETVR